MKIKQTKTLILTALLLIAPTIALAADSSTNTSSQVKMIDTGKTGNDCIDACTNAYNQCKSAAQAMFDHAKQLMAGYAKLKASGQTVPDTSTLVNITGLASATDDALACNQTYYNCVVDCNE